MTKNRLSRADWRISSDTYSTFESAHILLGYFLADRTSENLISDEHPFPPNGILEWEYNEPLEKVINSRKDLDFLLAHPDLLHNSITIIEPWDHVGFNHLGESVRASKNIAYIAQKVATINSILLPVWSTGIMDPDVVIPAITSGYAVIIEGGDPSTYDPSTWSMPACPREDMFKLIDKLLISRSPDSAPAIFICVGHQLAAECHIRLIRRAVKEIMAMTSFPADASRLALKILKDVATLIETMGASLHIKKQDGRTAANGWNDNHFAVTKNESIEIGDRNLLPYQAPEREKALNIPLELIHAHALTADAHDGVIDTMIQYEREISISMFHQDEVNEEAILFANWAYRNIHDAIVPYRHMLAGSSLSWILQLPDSIEILCSTAEKNGEIVTECSATCINYKDFETKKIRRSFTCQFHPELLSDLRAVGWGGQPPSYAKLKKDDGARLLVRLLYEGMQE
jgi:GMP synthase-like glutamine amidotransferase